MEEGLGGSPAASHKHPAISPKLFLIIPSQVDPEALLLSQGSSELLRQGQYPPQYKGVLLRDLRDQSCWPRLWLWDMNLLSLP